MLYSQTNRSESHFETLHIVCKLVEATTPNYKTNQHHWNYHKLKRKPKPIQVHQHTS